MNYKCQNCGSTEFISQLNKYDIYEVRNNKLVYVDSEYINEELKLFCRDCSNEIQFYDCDIVT